MIIFGGPSFPIIKLPVTRDNIPPFLHYFIVGGMVGDEGLLMTTQLMDEESEEHKLLSELIPSITQLYIRCEGEPSTDVKWSLVPNN